MHSLSAFAVCLPKNDRLFQRLEAGLTQQDRAVAARRAFDDGLRHNAASWHSGLDGVDVERARRQMIDMRAFEAHHVSYQPMSIMQLSIDIEAHCRFAVPAESFQGLASELRGLRAGQATVGLENVHQFERPWRENPALGKDLFSLPAKRLVLDKLDTQ